MRDATSPYKATSGLYLLDTNILVQYVRGSFLKEKIEAAYSLMTAELAPLISYVTEAEIRSLASQWDWGAQKRKDLDFLLTLFRRVPIEDSQGEIMQAYVLIDAVSTTLGYDMGKNDLWIAATARVITATLLTTDKDFDHLAGTFLSRTWISPEGITGAT
ncbi:MAG: type II toxin-antitoxin system VapC family toxin [Armatimonadota bacterium]